MTKILMVDDNEADHFLTKEMIKLKYPHVEFIAAYDGEEALELLADVDFNPDLILLDINMPRMNGHEFLAEYSEDNEKAHSIVIMLTSSRQDRDKENAMQYSCVKGYMVKPLSQDSVPDLETFLSKD